MTLHLIFQVIGIILILLALIHIIFPKYFHWKAELVKLSLVNRQIMEVHTFFIALTVGLNGLLCLTSADLLIHTELGKRICLGLAIFWGLRLITQFFWYSSKLWKGNPFETLAHWTFSIFWLVLTSSFAYATFV